MRTNLGPHSGLDLGVHSGLAQREAAECVWALGQESGGFLP
jgi:hypothetical protein